MSKPLVSDEFWELVQPLLPPQPPKPKGGIQTGPKWDTVRARIWTFSGRVAWEDVLT